jgi:hypothetical protein
VTLVNIDSARLAPIHERQIAVIICHARKGGFWFMCVAARGETEGSFAMSQLSGIVSLFLIAAAFLTSCDNQKPSQGAAPLPAWHLAE